MRFLNLQPGEVVKIEGQDLPPTVHVFDGTSIDAVDAALATGRPLLVRGEPGTGKSQLARAAAFVLGRPFLSLVVDARTEARDLLYTFDAVARLARAQVQQALGATRVADVERNLREELFVKPGPLWWAFHWEDAARQAAESGALAASKPEGWTTAEGAVVLVDEIDKADSSLPNGLLEALDKRRFPVPGGRTVRGEGTAAPLILITTNEERTLPDAFLRRCLVLQLVWPREDAAFVAELLRRGRPHFPGLAETVLRKAAERIAGDRKAVAGRGLYPPGGAEYLDLLLALDTLARERGDDPEALLERLGRFVLDKHPAEPAW